jgi:S1-C subfamily serine protease
MLKSFVFLLLFLTAPFTAAAQETAWVQIAARPTSSEAVELAAAYSGSFANVEGYALSSGWFAVALGPFGRGEAETVLSRLLNSGAVPGDSFVADGGNYQSRIWPVGAPLVAAAPAAPIEPAGPADETVQQAIASEATLSQAEREELQIALRWAGFYKSGIDGAFGRGSRAAMEAWQTARGHKATGVLTTGQRAALLAEYNTVFEGMGLEIVADAAVGISAKIPLGVVAFDSYDPPFAKFAPSGDLPAQVLLISQPGDARRLQSLYEDLQTLTIVPREGSRRIRGGTFEIEGRNDNVHTSVYAQLDGDAIKGVALVWPAGDEERRSRLWAEMRASFTPLGGVLDPELVTLDENQSPELISGLEIRHPKRSASGFFLDASGAVLTSSDVVEGCGTVTIEGEVPMRVAHADPVLGVAILTPTSPLVPIASARLQTSVPKLGSEISVAGYSYGGVLSMPTLSLGKLADLHGLEGDDSVKRLDVEVRSGDAGGPVFDAGGAVLGMLLPRTNEGQVLPEGVNFAVDTDALLGAFAAAGVAATTTSRLDALSAEQLTRAAAEITVLVGCWD